MAKRLLLFVVFFLICVSGSFGQCNKSFVMGLNNGGNWPSGNGLYSSTSINLCRDTTANFSLIEGNVDGLKFQWFRNDTLVSELSSFKTSKTGIYHLLVQDNGCTYGMGSVQLNFVEKLNITLNKKELIICEDVRSLFDISSDLDIYQNNVKYQWQKDGKDIPNETRFYINPKNSGTYAVRATVGSCSASSPPALVKASTTNIISHPILITSFRYPVTTDTLLLCQDIDYMFTLGNNHYASWYRDGEYLDYGHDYIPKVSGTYYCSTKTAENCTVQSEPVYVSFGTKTNPIRFDMLTTYNGCYSIDPLLEDFNFNGSNHVKLYDASSGDLRYNFKTSHFFFSGWIKLGQYKAQLETGNCKSNPTYINFDKNSVNLLINGQKTEEKKITLCNNGSVNVSVEHLYGDDVSLYKDGVLYKKKTADKTEYLSTNLSESGKYYFKVSITNCKPQLDIISDTLEIVAPTPISSVLTLERRTCDDKILYLKEYEGATYSWYRNNVAIPSQNSSVLSVKNNSSGIFHALIQNGFCSVSTQSIEIEAGTKITGTSTLCEGTNLSFESSSKEGSFIWNGPNNFSSTQPAISIKNVDMNNAGWYTLQTTKNGCTIIDSLQVNITAKPDVSLSIVTPICPDKPLVLLAKGKPGVYLINYNFYETIKMGRYISVNSENANQYLNLGTLSKELPTNNQNYLNLVESKCLFPIQIPPVATTETCNVGLSIAPLKDSYCSQEGITLIFNKNQSIPPNTRFSISLESNGSNYKWVGFSGENITLRLPSMSASEVFFYIESEDGKYKTFSTKFTVKYAFSPDIYAQYGNSFSSSTVQQCEGYSTKLISSGGIIQSLQWKRDGKDIVGANSGEFEAREAGVYTLNSIYNGCAVISNHLEVKVGQIPKPSLSSLIGTTQVCNGFFVPLKRGGAFPYTHYTWKRNGQIVEENSTDITFNAKASGYYTLSAKQGSCSANSDSLFIEVGEKIPNSILGRGTTVLENNRMFICDSTFFRLYHSGFAVGDSLKNNYGISFQWKRNDKNIPNATNYDFAYFEPGTYTLQVKQGECITNSNKVEVVRTTTIPLKLNNTFSYGFSTLKDTISACAGSAFELFAYKSYEDMQDWDKELYKDEKMIDSHTMIKGNSYSNYFPIYETGKYSIKLYRASQKTCVALSDTGFFNFPDSPITMPTDTVYFCADSARLSSRYAAESYRWLHNNEVISNASYIRVGDEGLYTVESKETNTCSYIEPILFLRKLAPQISQSPNLTIGSPINLCDGEKVNLYVRNLDDKPNSSISDYMIEWYNNQQMLSNKVLNILNISQTGNYYTKVKDKNCEAVSNTIKIDIIKLKNQILPSVDSLGICVNGGFQTLEVSEQAGYTYEWFKDNIAVDEKFYSLKANQPGTYKALIQSGDCSALTPKVKVYASTQPPTATISGDTTLNIGDIANLKLSFTSSPPFTYKLNNNQEGTSDNNNIVHPVKIEEATIFKLASIKNACGEGTVSGEAKIQVIILANEPLIGHKITIAPVPAESYCEIIIDLPTSQTVSYQLLDMKGQQLSEKSLGKVTYKKQYLNLNQLAAGEYLIRIQVGKEFVTRKLIKF